MVFLHQVFLRRFRDVNHIDCNDMGVPYAEAEVDKPLNDVVHKVDISELDKLVPSYGQQGCTSLLLAIQVNVFSCSGLAIGVKMSHAISDAFSSFMFVKTWASIAREGNYKHNNPNSLLLSRPYFEIWKLFPPSQARPIFSNLPGDQKVLRTGPNLIKGKPICKWFMFRETKLDALRSKMFSPAKYKSKKNLPSLAMVLSIFIWRRLIMSLGDQNIPHEAFLPVNLRPKVDPPDEQSFYFGNMAISATARSSSMVQSWEDESQWWHDILGQFKDSIGKILRKDGFIREMQQGKEDLRYIIEQNERQIRGESLLTVLSNQMSLPVYEADFGWGKPVWVAKGSSIHKNLVIMLPAAPSSKDIVAYISLSGEDMPKLESDLEFTTFVSNK